jgi:hypothetical protein
MCGRAGVTNAGDQEGFFRAIIDAIPSPMFIVDEDVRIRSYNTAAGALFKDPAAVLQTRAGEVLHCINSTDVPEGCGRGPACVSCIVRGSVGAAFRDRTVVRKAQRMVLADGERRTEVYFLVTTSPLATDAGPFVVLLLEDIGDLVEARSLLPLCMHCGRIKDDKDYWTNVDQYFKRHLDLDFSHGLCQDCLKKHYPDLAE